MLHVDPTHIADQATEAPAADARALIEQQQAMLTRLAQIGMAVAEALGREAVAGSGDDAVQAGLAFARVARAVRMTIALQSRLMKDLAALDRADDEAQAAAKSRRRMRLRILVGRAAGAAIDARIDAGQLYSGEDAIEDEIERLASEAYERLTDAEDGDLMDRPFDEVVAGICADLGLSADWSARVLATVRPPARQGAAETAAAGPAPPSVATSPDRLWPPSPPGGPTPAAPPRGPP